MRRLFVRQIAALSLLGKLLQRPRKGGHLPAELVEPLLLVEHRLVELFERPLLERHSLFQGLAASFDIRSVHHAFGQTARLIEPSTPIDPVFGAV
jgi:hypothetical protein